MKLNIQGSAVEIAWVVRDRWSGHLLGVIHEKMWFDAREKACTLYGRSPAQLELTHEPVVTMSGKPADFDLPMDVYKGTSKAKRATPRKKGKRR